MVRDAKGLRFSVKGDAREREDTTGCWRKRGGPAGERPPSLLSPIRKDFDEKGKKKGEKSSREGE